MGDARTPAAPAERPPNRPRGPGPQRRLLGWLQPAAGKRLVTTFLDGGTVDDSLYKLATVDFTPAVSHSTIAKIVVGAMLGLAALTVLSLLWMARRVHRRGAYGRKASAALRSVYPIVLGLGGWFLGVLIVLVAFPAVPLDDQPGSPFVGVPVGFGVYLAWMNGRARLGGFGVSMAGALAGAWLGMQAQPTWWCSWRRSPEQSPAPTSRSSSST